MVQREPSASRGPARPLGQAMSLNGDSEALAAYYAKWADTYDSDVGDETRYGLPNSVLVTLKAAAEREPALADPNIEVLDAGCGTGRIGAVLAGEGFRVIDGVDLSPEMVERARARGIYRHLEGGYDLTQPARPDRAARYQLVICGGVFTVGHVPPSALHEVAGHVAPGGVLVITVRPAYYDTTDYQQVSDALVSSGAADLLVSFDDLAYTEDSNGRYYAYRINGEVNG